MVLFWKVKYEEHGITNDFVFYLKSLLKIFGTGDMIYFYSLKAVIHSIRINPFHKKMYEKLMKLWRVILRLLWRKGFLHLHNNFSIKTCIVLKGERKWRLGKYIKFKNIIASFVLQLRMRGFHQTGYLKPNKMARNSLMMPHHCFRQVIFEVR